MTTWVGALVRIVVGGLVFASLSLPGPLMAHPGRLDAKGCHHVETKFVYKSGKVAEVGDSHCHRSLGDMRLDGLEVLQQPPLGFLESIPSSPIPPCWPAGVPSVNQWTLHRAEMREADGHTWLGAHYRLPSGQMLSAVWLDGEIVAIDPDPAGPVPMWIQAGRVEIRDGGPHRLRRIEPPGPCRWERWP